MLPISFGQCDLNVKTESAILHSKLYETLVATGTDVRLKLLRSAAKIDTSLVRETLQSRLHPDVQAELELLLTLHGDAPRGYRARLLLSKGEQVFAMLAKWQSTPANLFNLKVLLSEDLTSFASLRPGVFLSAALMVVMDSEAYTLVKNGIVKELLATWKTSLHVQMGSTVRLIPEEKEIFAWSKNVFMAIVSLKTGMTALRLPDCKIDMEDSFIREAVRHAGKAWGTALLKKVAPTCECSAQALAKLEQDEARCVCAG